MGYRSAAVTTLHGAQDLWAAYSGDNDRMPVQRPCAICLTPFGLGSNLSYERFWWFSMIAQPPNGGVPVVLVREFKAAKRYLGRASRRLPLGRSFFTAA